MSRAPIVRTESLGGSPISRAAQAGQLGRWYPAVPRDANGWQAHVQSVMRSTASDWYERLAPAIAASGAAAERLQRAAGGRGLVVTTGQQPGLFGGPLMTFNKALTARAIADVLQEQLGIPVAPVFWAATDDADFDEAARVSVALEDGAHELVMSATAPAGTAMTRVPLGSDVAELFETFRRACGSAPHASYLDHVARAYRAGVTVGDAYVDVLRSVLEPLEIAVLDVSHHAVAHASRDVLGSAARRAAAVANALDIRNGEIATAGFAAQVETVKGLSVVFVNEHGTKRRLPIAEAERFAAASDDRWLSSTVLMRPVLERALLPTAAYIGGPGEIAYFAQVSAVADALQLARPLVLPRWSATVVEPRVQQMLDELGVTMESLDDPHAVESRLARARLPRHTDDALRALQREVEARLDALADASDGLVPDESVAGIRKAIAHRLDRLERRFVAGVKRRETDLMRTIAAARGALYPHGARQERRLAYVPLLARYGPGLIEQMLGEARTYASALVSADSAVKAPSSQTAVRV
jgi:bacillithiol biosynthesis cysteine-adding enzyme BshC